MTPGGSSSNWTAANKVAEIATNGGSLLREQACDEYQGYYFSKPIDGRAFAELMRARNEGDDNHPQAA